MIEEIELSILQDGGLTQCAPSPKGDVGGMAPPRTARGKSGQRRRFTNAWTQEVEQYKSRCRRNEDLFLQFDSVLRAFIYQSQMMDLLNAITSPNINPQVAYHPTKFIQADELRSDHGIPYIRIVD